MGGVSSWGGHREGVVVGKSFRKGSCRKSRNNLLGRRHQPWGRTEDGHRRSLPCSPQKSLLAPALHHLPPRPGCVQPRRHLEILLSRARGPGCRVWGAGHGKGGAACGDRAPDTGHGLPVGQHCPAEWLVAFHGHCDAPCSSYFIEELGTAKEQVSVFF